MYRRIISRKAKKEWEVSGLCQLISLKRTTEPYRKYSTEPNEININIKLSVKFTTQISQCICVPWYFYIVDKIFFFFYFDYKKIVSYLCNRNLPAVTC